MEVERRETLESCKSWFRQEEAVGFSKSLQELRELRSQLHYAADYCETTFLNSPEKKLVVENTQEYICRAVVTIVDHLGRVSSNLNDCFFNDNDVSDTELRIQCLKQRLLSWETYTSKLALAQLQWDPHMPLYHTRYKSKQTSTDGEKVVGITRDSYDPMPAKVKDASEYKTEEGVPVLLYKPALAKSSSKRDASSALVLPVRDGIGLSGALNPAFHFQAMQKRGGGRNLLNRKGADHILSLIRRTKRNQN